jgi:PIN domain nuclease of toxin-antitoxin system
VRCLLDTATLLFAGNAPQKLSARAEALVRSPTNTLELSSISLTEIAIKNAVGKLNFSAAEIRQVLQDLRIRILPYTQEHAFELFDLPVHHRDPFDRQIIAQALAEEIAVATPDAAFSLYRRLRVIW